MLVKRGTAEVETPPTAEDCARAAIWHVLRAPPGRELESGRFLVDCGFLAWCPLQTAWRRVGRGIKVRKRNVARPAFVGYVFVGVPVVGRVRWKPAFETGLVAAILAGPDGYPVRLAPSLVADVAERQRSGAFDKALQEAALEAAVKPGDRVRVIEGPFRGFEYGVETVEAGRLRVLATMLGADRFVELALDAVELAA